MTKKIFEVVENIYDEIDEKIEYFEIDYGYFS